MLKINSRVMWKLRGQGNWVVEDYSSKVKYLFVTKREATSFAKNRCDVSLYKRG